MSRKVLLLVQLLVMLDLLSNTSAIQTNAYSNNIDTCLFQSWQSGSEAVLSGPVNCGDKVKQFQLCYNKAGQNPAQYAVCYNNETLIPDFTGHVVVTNIQGAGRKCSWHDEGGTQYAPSPESSVNDYKCTLQDGLYQNKDINAQQFCSRGHYTPNADFSDCEERQMTFINTNIAPQWQLFNAENWAALEAAVRNYANSVQRSVYVFTGTGGQATNADGTVIKLNKKVLAPKYYWKAVCDPSINASVVFVAQNPIGNINATPTKGCNNLMQSPKLGVIQCFSLNEAASSTGQFSSDNFVPFLHFTASTVTLLKEELSWIANWPSSNRKVLPKETQYDNDLVLSILVNLVT